MGKLNKLAKVSEIMNLRIQYGKETFEFNLNQELAVKEVSINDAIKAQPQAYSFLLMLHKKLINSKKELELDRKELHDRLFVKIQKKQETKLALAAIGVRVEKNLEYQKLKRKILKVEADCDYIETCVRGFEMRANLIQTLSSNLRRENNQ